jgi:hypothetical protein
VRAICIGLVVVGLLLLVAALRRGRPRALTLPAQEEAVHVSASRRGLERTVAAAAGRVDGVHSASAKARRRTVRVKAATPLRDPGDLKNRLTTVVSDRLTEVGLGDRLRARVTVSSKGSR